MSGSVDTHSLKWHMILYDRLRHRQAESTLHGNFSAGHVVDCEASTPLQEHGPLQVLLRPVTIPKNNLKLTLPSCLFVTSVVCPWGKRWQFQKATALYRKGHPCVTSKMLMPKPLSPRGWEMLTMSCLCRSQRTCHASFPYHETQANKTSSCRVLMDVRGAMAGSVERNTGWFWILEDVSISLPWNDTLKGHIWPQCPLLMGGVGSGADSENDSNGGDVTESQPKLSSRTS